MILQASTMLKMTRYGNKMREMYTVDLQLAPFELSDGRVSKVVIDFEGDRD